MVDVEQWLEQWVEDHLDAPEPVREKAEMHDQARACANDAAAAGIPIADLKQAANGDLETYLVERQNIRVGRVEHGSTVAPPGPHNTSGFEAWICKQEPSVRLVIAVGGTMPSNLGNRDWTLEGPYQASPDVARDIAEKGYRFVVDGVTETAAEPNGLTDRSPADRQTGFK
ncbi:hypothetical protein [Lichenihabitans psoromatis]|uniref:hypothetical protein n=1 Tax=Lichenihabitans psoromatis TaxID=2528642 RepID=UPI0010383386|nr:hypothetical protein [Lichenihabitans psoromatis]